jgi:AraC-like DNA-binding protein
VVIDRNAPFYRFGKTRALCSARGSRRRIASRLGYESEAAFSRAFKRSVGISPGAALGCRGWRSLGKRRRFSRSSG